MTRNERAVKQNLWSSGLHYSFPSNPGSKKRISPRWWCPEIEAPYFFWITELRFTRHSMEEHAYFHTVIISSGYTYLEVSWTWQLNICRQLLDLRGCTWARPAASSWIGTTAARQAGQDGEANQRDGVAWCLNRKSVFHSLTHTHTHMYIDSTLYMILRDIHNQNTIPVLYIIYSYIILNYMYFWDIHLYTASVSKI